MKRQLATLAAMVAVSAMVHAGVQLLLPARADQSERVVPTSGIYTGPQYAQKIGDLARSISTANKGSSAPANVGGAAVDGLEWLDDSVSPWVLKRYVNGGWATQAAFDPSTSSYVGVVGGGIAALASAATVDLGAVPQANVGVTGTTSITSFGSSAPSGAIKIIRFAAPLTLVYSTALPVPCGADLVTAAGDRAIVTHLGSGTWEITSYQRANGVPIDCAAVAKIEYGQFETVPALHVAGYGQALSRASYPYYLAKVTRAQTGTRISGNATITGLGSTAAFGAGMPVEGTGIGSGCTILSVTATTLTLNSSSCVISSGTAVVTVFLTGYGTSGSASTVGAADCRGRALAGRDRSDPGTLSNRLTASYFGADGGVMNNAGGLESVAMGSINLIAHNHAVFLKDPGHSHLVNMGSTGGLVSPQGSLFPSGSNYTTPPATTGITIGSVNGVANDNLTAVTGSASPTPMRTVQPTLIAECVVRVTP